MDNLLLDDDVVVRKKVRWMQMMVLVGTAKLFETRIIVFHAFCVPLSVMLVARQTKKMVLLLEGEKQTRERI